MLIFYKTKHNKNRCTQMVLYVHGIDTVEVNNVSLHFFITQSKWSKIGLSTGRLEDCLGTCLFLLAITR